MPGSIEEVFHNLFNNIRHFFIILFAASENSHLHIIRMKIAFFIGIGGFIGSVSRYYIARFVQTTSFSSFPFGTLTVNLIGCLLIGLVYGFSEKGLLINPDLRLFLTVGILGGFTTFSTFSTESFFLLRDGQIIWFLSYSAASVAFSIFAVFAGFLISKLF